jgi:hypothetical protein
VADTRVPTITHLQARLRLSYSAARDVRSHLKSARECPIPTADSAMDVALLNCSPLIGGHGVEHLATTDIYDPGVSYVNMGDPYIPTIVYDARTGSLVLGAWGYLVENNQRRFA